MDALRWERLESLFSVAVGLPAMERSAFLEDACPGDAGMRLQVESLVSAHEEASGFIGRAVAETAREAAETARPGVRLGAYEIVRELGRGGMGAVFLGRRADGEYEADVAIKLVRGVHTAEQLRRFRVERQILARLRHPNIAQLLDGGTTAVGVPFVVMEHVEGVPLDAFCDAGRMGVDERLDLFLRVCEAVRFAHRNLVVHCDLKPRNVLVTPAGVPKLLDFGIARLLESSSSAAAGEAELRFGTPAYASPEQVSGAPVSMATDVYGLGVVLYELLTGRLPREAPGRRASEDAPPPPSEVVRAAAREDPEAARVAEQRRTDPGRLSRRLSGDLDAILLRALQSDPARRYESVEGFAGDLARHRAAEPVRARPQGLGYRAGRFVRRHRLGVGAAASAALLVGASAAALAVQAERVARERDAATLARADAEQVSAFLVDLFRVPDPSESRGDEVTAREILDRGAAGITTTLRDQPETRATMMDVMGRVYQNLALFPQAAPLLDSALAIRRATLGDVHPDVAASLHAVAGLRAALGDYDSARVLYREALTMRRRLLPAGHPDLARTLVAWGTLESDAGDYTAAEPLYREGLAIGRAALGEENPEVASMLLDLGSVLRRKGDYTAAEPLLREGVERRRRLLGADHPDMGQALNQLARLLVLQGRAAEAEPIVREGLENRRRNYGDAHMEVAASLGNLAGILTDLGDVHGAIAARRESLAIIRGLFGEEHPYTAGTLQSLAHEQQLLGALDSARVNYERAVDLQRRVLAAGDPNRGFALTGLGRVLVEAGRPAEAEPYLREALAVRRGGLPADHWFIAATELALGDCLARLGREAEAEPLLARALATLEAAFGPKDSRTEEARGRLDALRAGRTP